jgi:hypothetical protein
LLPPYERWDSVASAGVAIVDGLGGAPADRRLMRVADVVSIVMAGRITRRSHRMTDAMKALAGGKLAVGDDVDETYRWKLVPKQNRPASSKDIGPLVSPRYLRQCRNGELGDLFVSPLAELPCLRSG